MHNHPPNIDIKDFIKPICKFLIKVSPLSDYQHQLKMDIHHLVNILQYNDVELLIVSTKLISERYAFTLVRRVFHTLQKKGSDRM